MKTDHGLSFIIIGQEHLERTESKLAVALAQGVSVTARARARESPRTTVWTWASEPEVQTRRNCETKAEGTAG